MIMMVIAMGRWHLVVRGPQEDKGGNGGGRIGKRKKWDGGRECGEGSEV